MKRSLLIAAAVLSTISGAIPAAEAGEGAGYSLACCRRSVPRTYYVPRPNVSQYNVQHNEWHNNDNSINVFPQSPSITKAPAFFTRVVSPQLQLPPNGPDLTAGRTYTLKLNHLEDKGGDVTLFIGGTSLNCPVLNWAPNEVTFEVPNMGVAPSGSVAELHITKSDGTVSSVRIVRVINPPDLVEHEEPTPGTAGVQVGMYPYASGPTPNTSNGG